MEYSHQTLGSKEAKNILIFLHGWGGSKQSFESLSNKIIDQGKDLQIILLDLPGFGDADMPAEDGWTTHDYQSWFEGFLSNELKLSKNKNIHLYGHSFGCRIIIRHLLKNPSFPGKIFLTGAAGIKWPPSFKTRCTKLLNKVFTPFKYLLPEKIKKKILRRLGAGDWADIDPALKNTFQKTLKEEDLRIHLSKIYQDCYIIWGKKDSYTPYKSAEVFHRALHHSKLKIFPHGKHGIHHTHTDEIAEIVVDFVSKK